MPANNHIPLSVPNLSGNEWTYIRNCLDTNWVSSVGAYVEKFEKSVAAFTGARYAVATSNGTAALHISLMLAGTGPKDSVLVPDLTFVAPVNAIKYTGAEPLLVDVDKNTWQIDLPLLENFLEKETRQKEKSCIHKSTGRTIRAVLPVHVLGNMCDMNALREIAKKFNLLIIEDATEALGSRFEKKHSGTFGMTGCFSFNGNKIITTGGGGMIVTDSEKIAKHAKHLTTQAKSDPSEYVHDEVGYNYRLVNILAAMGLAQMELLPSFLERKKEVSDLYRQELSSVPGIKFQHTAQNVSSNNWLFTVSVPRHRKLIEFLRKNRIETRPLWKPMHRLKMFRKCTYISRNDVSSSLYNNCISLPCSTGITNAELLSVIKKIKSFYGK